MLMRTPTTKPRRRPDLDDKAQATRIDPLASAPTEAILDELHRRSPTLVVFLDYEQAPCTQYVRGNPLTLLGMLQTFAPALALDIRRSLLEGDE